MSVYTSYRKALDIQPLGPVVSAPHAAGVAFVHSAHARTLVSNAVRTLAAVGITDVTDFHAVHLTCETAAIRYRYDGLNPTASVGHRLASGGQVMLIGRDNIANLRFIRETGTNATLHLTFDGDMAGSFLAVQSTVSAYLSGA